MKKLIVGLASISPALLGNAALACSCGEFAGPHEHFRSTEIIFEGRVISSGKLDLPINENERPEIADRAGDSVTTFEVTRAIKGSPIVTRDVQYDTESSCAVGFAEKTLYRIYAHKHEGQLITGMCRNV